MNILLVNTDKAKIYPQMFEGYLKSKNISCYSSRWRKEEIIEVISSRGLTPSNTLIYARTAGPHVTETYKELELEGYKIINKSYTTELSSNKYESQIFALKRNIPAANTYKINKESIEEIQRLAKKHGSVIAKPIFSQGQGIYCEKINDGMSENEIIKLISEIPGQDIIIQEYIKYQRLIRTIVVGFKMLKEASTFDMPIDGNWKASVCMNPAIKKYEITDNKLVELAEKTARAFESEISFIDFFEDVEGNFILNELNTACSLIIHEKVTGVKIHQYICDYLIKSASLLVSPPRQFNIG
jgi:glutathione synthase/RimK-type ligase-like ATP-grasp enzyme